MPKEKILSPGKQEELLKILKVRFEKNMDRHKDIDWYAVESKLNANPYKIWSLNEMEITGGEPDVVDFDEKTEEYIFNDCSPESPAGRRSLCYDKAALESRKKYKPKKSAKSMAEEMGIEILTEKQYMTLQELGEFDIKTSSWLETPDDIRGRGGAIYGDRRFGRVFIYHNGAESYYEVRGFRGSLRV